MVEKLSLSELQLIIKDSLYLALPDMYWVAAEISEIKENYAGHCYLELVEKHPDDKNIRARAKAVIWGNRYRFLKSFFENITGQPLREGLKILVKTKIEYHEIYGLSLVISDIDPAFTMGEMAVKRQMIIKRLEEEGVFTMNRELDFPVIPQKIAVISSRNAAGYTDFINHLTQNNFGYVFYTALIETAMQGNDTEAGVINALDKIASKGDLFDLVVIIRGGGSQTDLSWFDNYNIAYHITQFPLPVITGIGHEKDLSVTDMVAFQSLKTPTAVAGYLIECMNNADNQLNEMSLEIIDKARIIVEDNKRRIETSRMKLIPVARMWISEIKEQLSDMKLEMINFGKEFISRAVQTPSNQKARLDSASKTFFERNHAGLKLNKQYLISFTVNSLHGNNIKITMLENSLKILNPVNVLRRGYTITSINGKILKSSAQVRKEDLIDTQFSDGSVKSRVFEKTSGKS
ncbi:MAG TPA: exodeoxyribonuclease VII large subunit [Bacteroidales bacterium]|nr:exodeoxyribonuclease VII large subunit [Bacteroidales bacterium]